MQKVKEWLSGKKTYLVCAAAILAAVIAYSQDQVTLIQLIEAVLAAIGGMTLRAGVTKSAL